MNLINKFMTFTAIISSNMLTFVPIKGSATTGWTFCRARAGAAGNRLQLLFVQFDAFFFGEPKQFFLVGARLRFFDLFFGQTL